MSRPRPPATRKRRKSKGLPRRSRRVATTGGTKTVKSPRRAKVMRDRGTQTSLRITGNRRVPKSGYYGVKTSGHHKWRAQAWYNGKHKHLGYFRTKQEAALAYDVFVRKHKGVEMLDVRNPYNYASIEEGEAAAAAAAAGWQQQQQPRPRPASGYYGVSASGHRWQATLKHTGKQRYLGRFNTKEEAALAYDEFAREHRGAGPYNFNSIEEGRAAVAAATTAAAEIWEELESQMSSRAQPAPAVGNAADEERALEEMLEHLGDPTPTTAPLAPLTQIPVPVSLEPDWLDEIIGDTHAQ